jgi:hypothetical protein
MLLLPVLLLAFACQAVMGPVNDVKNVAGTAGAVATQAIEMATNAAPMATAFAQPTQAGDPNVTNVPAPTGQWNLYDPQGIPLSSWRDIPIMPDALAGQEGEGMYSFKVDASLQEVRAFYDAQLPPLGWVSTFSGSDMPILFYTKGDDYLSITIMEQEGGTIVLLTPS